MQTILGTPQKMRKSMRTTFLTIAILSCLSSSSPASNIFIPNSDFETITKPSPDTSVTATSLNGWTNGMGNTSISCCGTTAINWSDSTTGAAGDPVVVPGWQNVSGGGGVQGGLGVGGSFGVWINGTNFGGNGGSIESSSNLGTIQPGESYTLTI